MIGEIEIKGIENEEIYDCLKTLCKTYAGTCPLDREFGIDPNIISLNRDIAKEYLIQDLYEKVEKYVPEVEIINIDFEENTKEQQKIFPTIYFKLKGEENEYFR